MDFQSVDHSLAFDQIDNQLNVDPFKEKKKKKRREKEKNTMNKENICKI